MSATAAASAADAVLADWEADAQCHWLALVDGERIVPWLEEEDTLAAVRAVGGGS